MNKCKPLAVGFESGDVCFLERSGGLDTRGIVKVGRCRLTLSNPR